MKQLFASSEDYLKAIFILKKERGIVRSVDLAGHMGYSKASISHAVSGLRKAGLLTMDRDFSLHLTSSGTDLAGRIYERHCFFVDFLVSTGVDSQKAYAEACRLEHAVSQDTFERLKVAYEKWTGD